MATVYWIGGTDGDWDYDNTPTFVGSNWHDAPSGGNEVAKPVNGDRVIFTVGSQDVDDGLDQTAGPLRLGDLLIWPGYTGAIGSGGGHLLIDIDNDAGAILYVGGGTGLWITGTFKLIEVLAPLPSTTVVITNSGTVTRLRHYRGTLSVAGNTFTDTHISQVSARTDAAYSATSATTLTTLRIFSGISTIASKVTSMILYGNGQITQTLGDWPTAVTITAGTFLYSSTNAGGTMLVYGYGGLVDARGSTGKWAISVSSFVHPGCVLDIRNGSVGITGSLFNFGGTYYTDIGDVVTLVAQ